MTPPVARPAVPPPVDVARRGVVEFVVTANGKEKAVTLHHWRARKVANRCEVAGMSGVVISRRIRECGL